MAKNKLIEKLRDLACDLIAFDNDFYSLKKDLYRKDVHNWILVIQHERGCSLQEACDKIASIRETKVKEFLSIADDASIEFNENIKEDMKKYVYNLKLMIHDNLIWHQRSRRYNDESIFFRNVYTQ